jgi:hypothetical protein
LGDANLTGANLTDTNLTGADLLGANLSGAGMTGTALAGANLILATLPGADLTGKDLTGTFFAMADLTGADLTGANLTCSDDFCANYRIRGTNLTDANLTDADLTGADLIFAILTGVRWDNTTCPDGSTTNTGCSARPDFKDLTSPAGWFASPFFRLSGSALNALSLAASFTAVPLSEFIGAPLDPVQQAERALLEALEAYLASSLTSDSRRG